ncbi:MAG: hypothetical protein IPP15_15300 [Saprospiraceae bacterium]|uniref:HEPN domain-containing protein n=1 Tax=Candidatus Opimibacter skivensis TaxID=2982028 RepID=A0A9D7SV79_9BACT|nr:hypothetical protein [Candidatus Opimibacter skivensis]
MTTAHLDHAKHNHKLADQLFKEGEFMDWALTVAYYASINYVKHHIFPLPDHGLSHLGEPIKSFDDYCTYFKPADRHAALCDLFMNKCNKNIGISLRTLMNDCKTARYNDYMIESARVRAAMSTLKSVEKICISKRVADPNKKQKRPRIQKAIVVRK